MLELDNCIICGSAKDLNTDLTIMVDDEDTGQDTIGKIKVRLQVCDLHAEDTTPKMAREKYQDKKLEIDKVIAQAKALGLEINIPTPGNKIAIATKVHVPATSTPATPATLQQFESGFIAELDDSENVLDTAKIDSVAQSVQGVGGNVSGSAPIQSHTPMTPGKDKLDPIYLEGKALMGLAEGRGGQPVAIPRIRQDGTGTTRISVNQGDGDLTLQRRFKSMAGHADAPQQGAYGTQCTFCHGEGKIAISKTDTESCPKCSGSGFL